MMSVIRNNRGRMNFKLSCRPNSNREYLAGEEYAIRVMAELALIFVLKMVM